MAAMIVVMHGALEREEHIKGWTTRLALACTHVSISPLPRGREEATATVIQVRGPRCQGKLLPVRAFLE